MSILHFIHGADYPADILEYCWKNLLKNQPHDSICGCSVDEVHREMMYRFDAVLQTGSALIEESLRKMITPADQITVMLLNPEVRTRSVLVDRYFMLPAGIRVDTGLVVQDGDGRSIPAHIKEIRYAEDFWLVDFARADSVSDQKAFLDLYRNKFPKRFHLRQDKQRTRIPVVRIQFMAEELPPAGMAFYSIHEGGPEADQAPADIVRINGNTIENRYYRVVMRPDGTFELTDKSNSRTYRDLNVLEDTGDVGDEYDYAPALNSQTVTSKNQPGQLTVADSSPYLGTLCAGFKLPLPAACAPDRRRRLKRRVACTVSTCITLESGSRIVKITTRFDNRVRDHRLRVLFPTGLQSDEIVSGGHFYLNRRNIQQTGGENWAQVPGGTFPQQGFSLITESENGFILLNKGLPEIAPLKAGDSTVTLALTLLRAVEWLSRDDLSTRRDNAGPMMFTPDAQCPGEHVFEYALTTFRGDFPGGEIIPLVDDYLVPAYIWQRTGKLSTEHKPAGLLSVDSEYVRVTALKKNNLRDSLICRMYNVSDRNISGVVSAGLPVKDVWRTDLLENREAKLAVSDGREFLLDLKPFEIATVEIEFKQI